jgi:hypothetical protein
MKNHKITLFTWGYWGWGNATGRLVEAVDSVEAARGFAPPVFVDVRLSRSVRAPGFRERAFEHTVGSERYRWMKQLGNKRIASGTGPLIQIAEPSAATELLDLALDVAKQDQRVIFFCACDVPAHCHRAEVAKLVSAAARTRRGVVEIIEWPGGEPESLCLKIPNALLMKIRGGQHSIPLPESADISRFAGLPWYSDVHLKSDQDEVESLCSPAVYKVKGGWQLTSLAVADGPVDPLVRAKRAQQYRKQGGYKAVA